MPKAAASLRIKLKGTPIDIHPKFLSHVCEGDLDVFSDFFEALSKKECGIIARHGKDLKKLKYMKDIADRDFGNAAKALAIEG